MSTLKNEKLDKLLSIKDGIGICWVGNAGWLLNANGCIAAFDLDLNNKGKLAPPPISAEDIAEVLNINFITHEHEDHFSSITSEILIEKSSCTFVVPASCAKKARELGIPEKRIHVTVPGDLFTLFNFIVKPQRALHGHFNGSVYRYASLQDCGYLLTVNGLAIYQPGDTVLLHEHLEMENVDALFVSPTEHNTYVNNSSLMIEHIKPKYIFPQHYGTYVEKPDNTFWTKGYVDQLELVLGEDMKTRFHRLKQGETFTIL